MKKIAALIVAAGACAANAQFAVVSGVNSTDAMRGLNNAEVGDVISAVIVATGGGPSNLFGVFFQIDAGDTALSNFSYSANPNISAIFSTQISNIGVGVSGLYSDLVVPTGVGIAVQANFGSSLGPDPVSTLSFDFVYGGGTVVIDLVPLGFNYQDNSFVTTYEVEALVVTPAPASAALLALGGLVAARRRRA
jgi:hypothetical protein